MKKGKVEIGKKVEFYPLGGSFSYSDSDRTLRYKDSEGKDQQVTAPEGFTMRFQISKGYNFYYIGPADINSTWSYHSGMPITQDSFSDFHESVFGKSSLLTGGVK